MMGEWKPGDVALVVCSDDSERPAMFIHYLGRPTWMFGDSALRDVDTSAARPLVVIDPEDREQVARLLGVRYGTHYGRVPVVDIDSWQTALRQYADPKPPKPEEPQGLGAVVEDAHGDTWVRFKTYEQMPWRKNMPGHTSVHTSFYRDIDAVRVLSVGVQ